MLFLNKAMLRDDRYSCAASGQSGDTACSELVHQSSLWHTRLPNALTVNYGHDASFLSAFTM